jgi:DNA repair protein RecO (recombination protein O)
MTHKSKGIVLRSIKYGETSLVVTVFTELFGVQTYMVNGVRSEKRSSAKANHFQPSALLDLVVYHHSGKNMQRIKEFSWDILYREVLSNVIKNSIASFMVELLQKCLRQPEPNGELFHFCREALLSLDESDKPVAANFALYFTLQLPYFFGFQMTDNYHTSRPYLDLAEGNYVAEQPTHPHFIGEENAMLTSQLLKVMQPHELQDFKLNRDTRRILLLKYLDYYALHIPEFSGLKTLMVLHEVL